MDEKEKASLLAQDKAEWEAVAAALDARPIGTVHKTRQPWTARDVYTHIARWTDFNLNAVQVMVSGQRFQFVNKTADEMNAEWQAEDSRLSLAEAREWAHRSIARRFAFYEALPAGKLTGMAARLFRDEGAQHYREHLKYVTG